MGSKSNETVLQKQVSEPWSGVQPYMTDVLSKTQAAYNNNQLGSGYYPGATYVPPTSQEVVGMQGIQNLATQGNQLLPGLLNTAQSQIGGGGLSAEQRAGLAPLQQIANTQPGSGNPDFMRMLDTAADRTKTAMETSFGGMGRSDQGGAANGVIGREIGNLYTTGLANQYNQDVANSLNALGQLQGVYGQGQNNALQWGAMAPSLREQQFGDARQLIDLGGAQRQELQTENQSNIDRWTAQQNQQLQALQNYNNLISGIGGGGTSTVYGQQGSPIAGILGGAATGAGIGGSLGLGGMGGLLTAGLGGLLGGFI